MSDPGAFNVSLLLHCNGTNGSTTFTDSSLYHATMAQAGASIVSTTKSMFGGAAFYSPVSGRISTPAGLGSVLDLSTGDFTIEFFMNPDHSPNGQGVLLGFYDGTNATLYFYWSEGAAALNLYLFGVSVTAGNNSAPQTTWTYVALSCVSNVCYLFINATLISSTDITAVRTLPPINSWWSSGTMLTIGDLFSAGSPSSYSGYLDEIRITKGQGLYTSTFTQTAIEFPDPSLDGTLYGKFLTSGKAFPPIQSANLGNAKPRAWQPFENLTTKVPK